MSDQMTTSYSLDYSGKQSLPANPDAERALLSAMIISEEVCGECLVQLEEQCFYVPSNRRIFGAIKYLFDHDKPIDSVTLADHLETTGDLERVGGREVLVELSTNTFGLVSWKHYTQILVRDMTLRSMIAASQQISAMAFDAPEDTAEVVDKAEEMILGITEKNVSSSYSTVADIMEDLYTQLGDMCTRENDALGVQTGFPSIDRNLLGLRPGQMVVVGARPAVGKTSFALNLAVNAAIEGATVAFFSLEMSNLEIAQRLLASRSGVDMQAIRSGNVKNTDWPAILKATEELSQLDILIDDTPDISVTEIRAKARRMLHEKEKSVIILDYLQLVKSSGTTSQQSRANQVSEMSRGIKIMAKDLECPVIALSQLNRAGSNRTDKTPQLVDLRESGSIEQDADIVMLLDRSYTEEEAKADDRPDFGVTRCIIAKNRSGPVATVDLMFLGGKTKFVEVDHHHEE